MLHLRVRDGSAEETARIVAGLKAQGRQTMNWEKTRGSRLLLAELDVETRPGDARAAEPVAWCGYNATEFPELPEIFSQTVVPAMRGAHLGTLLGYVVARRLMAAGQDEVYFRMEVSDPAGRALFEHHLGYPCLSVEPGELPAQWVALCKQCELFGKTCLRQAFLKLPLPEFAAEIDRRFAIAERPMGFDFHVRAKDPSKPSRALRISLEEGLGPRLARQAARGEAECARDAIMSF